METNNVNTSVCYGDKLVGLITGSHTTQDTHRVGQSSTEPGGSHFLGKFGVSVSEGRLAEISPLTKGCFRIAQ